MLYKGHAVWYITISASYLELILFPIWYKIISYNSNHDWYLFFQSFLYQGNPGWASILWLPAKLPVHQFMYGRQHHLRETTGKIYELLHGSSNILIIIISSAKQAKSISQLRSILNILIHSGDREMLFCRMVNSFLLENSTFRCIKYQFLNCILSLYRSHRSSRITTGSLMIRH